MNTQNIKKAIELFELESKKNNITIKSCSINFNYFVQQTNISKNEFISNFSQHPFSLIRGYVMLTNGYKKH